MMVHFSFLISEKVLGGVTSPTLWAAHLVGMKEDLCEGQDEVENQPDIHHLDVGGLWELV